MKALHHYEDPHRQMSDAEVMTTAVVAALHLHSIGEVFLTVFQGLGELFKQVNSHSVYVIDSFLIAAGDNVRIPGARRYQA